MSERPEAGFSRVHPLSPLLRGGLLLVALAVTAGRQLVEGSDLSGEWWLVPLVLLGSLLLGAVSWWFTRYRVGADELRIDTGVLLRRSRRIRLDRIQAIEVQQPFLARLFGMASLAIDTAGGAESEATLSYLTLAQANRLRRYLLTEAGREGGVEVGTSDTEERVPDQLLHRVDPGLLLASQLLRTGPLLSAAGAALVATVGTAAGQPLSLAVLIPFGLAAATPVVQGFVSGYDFSVRRSARGVSVRAGLFGVRTAALPVQRIRGLVLTEPMVWRRLGWVAVHVTVAGVVVRGEDDHRLSTTLLPVARRADAQRLVEQVVPGLELGRLRLTRPPRAARRLDPVAWPVLGHGGDAQHVATRRGLLTRRVDIAPRRAVQSCGLRQGPLQRRLGLATVGLHLPSGPTAPTAVHRSAAEAWQITLTGAAQPSTGDDAFR